MKRQKPQRWSGPETLFTNPFSDFVRDQRGAEQAGKSPTETSPPADGSRAEKTGPGRPRRRGQRAALSIERKGRRGKTVTLVKGLHLSPADLADLARELRQACGAGGSLEGDVIEIQGDQRERAAEYLERLGIKAER